MKIDLWRCACCGRVELFEFNCRAVKRFKGEVQPIISTPKVGDKVCYVPAHYATINMFENGIVKEVCADGDVRVVYHCGGDWDNYMNYTAAKTKVEDLEEGWRE